MNKQNTYIAKPEDIHKAWYIVDATDKVLGRLASKVAVTLMGKGKVIYSTHQDVGDEVIVINASKIKTTGNKVAYKLYNRYSAYPGGLRQETLAVKLKKAPDYVIRHAVKGMLPKSKLGAKLLKKLKVYRDANHPHKAQNPKPLAV
jgi:large subunit ribosomal protein L13